MNEIIFESQGITPACPYEFCLKIPRKWRREIGLDLYGFIGAAIRRREPINRTAIVWLRWSERVIWDDADTWRTEKVFDDLVYTDQITHPGSRTIKLGELKFQTKGWTSGGTDGL